MKKGNLLKKVAKFSEAEQCYREALDRGEKVLNNYPSDTNVIYDVGLAYNKIAQVMLRKSKYNICLLQYKAASNECLKAYNFECGVVKNKLNYISSTQIEAAANMESGYDVVAEVLNSKALDLWSTISEKDASALNISFAQAKSALLAMKKKDLYTASELEILASSVALTELENQNNSDIMLNKAVSVIKDCVEIRFAHGEVETAQRYIYALSQYIEKAISKDR